jgi:hypothetical protein
VDLGGRRHADPIIVTLSALPDSLDRFITGHAELATTPEGGAAALIAALLIYPDAPALGESCLAATVDAARLAAGLSGHEPRPLATRALSLIRRQLVQNPYLGASYVRGTAPEDGYALPEPPWEIVCRANPYSGDRVKGPYKLFVGCSGAASPRPVSLRRDDAGLWRPFEWSSLLVGVRAPGR